MIRALLVENHPTVRKMTRRLLERNADIEVVGEAADGEQGLQDIHRLQPDVVLLDIFMPRKDGISVLEALRASLKRPKVVVLSMNNTSGLRETVLAAGADAFVAKRRAVEQLLPTIRAVVQRGRDVATPTE